jgi:hypothetical protein
MEQTERKPLQIEDLEQQQKEENIELALKYHLKRVVLDALKLKGLLPSSIDVESKATPENKIWGIQAYREIRILAFFPAETKPAKVVDVKPAAEDPSSESSTITIDKETARKIRKEYFDPCLSG